MGYTTTFEGVVTVDPPLNQAEIDYLYKFNNTRRMQMKQGPYYVDNPGMCGQDHGSDVVNYNSEAVGQPGLWCQWEPTDEGTAIRWDGGEKFYYATEWMEYIIEHFLKPGAIAASLCQPCETCGRADGGQFDGFTFDHVLNGTIDAEGEEQGDIWRLIVEDNIVSEKKAKVVWD